MSKILNEKIFILPMWTGLLLNESSSNQEMPLELQFMQLKTGLVNNKIISTKNR